MWKDHPVFSMVLGICSALAVSNKVEYAIAMGAGVTFVLIASAFLISSMKKIIPSRGRIIVYMITISTFVIVVDRVIRAFFPEIGEAIGPYIGLIITNCIIMGRAEAFFVQNKVSLSVIDGLSNGISYSYTLIAIAVVRELLGFGTILGFQVMPDFFPKWVVMIMAPGAFFVLTIFLWISRTLSGVTEE
jgi:Na+-transporting NADH:ubiquinone oxidoreductase subunit D